MEGRSTLEELARMAVEGDRDAVDSLVRALQREVYALALRMLWNREDAEDATQEILVRVVTRLSQEAAVDPDVTARKASSSVAWSPRCRVEASMRNRGHAAATA